MDSSLDNRDTQATNEKLLNPLIQFSNDIFDATGFELEWVHVRDGRWEALQLHPKNAICHRLTSGNEVCAACRHDLRETADALESNTSTLLATRSCHAGLEFALGHAYQGDHSKVYLVFGRTRIDNSKQERRFDAAKRLIEGALPKIRQMFATLAAQTNLAVSPSIRKATLYIEERFREPCDLPKVASAVGVSNDWLSRHFHRQMGCTIPSFINRVRIRHVEAHLLQTSLSITEIAYGCGFQSLATFQRVFKEMNDESPSAYRRCAMASRTAPVR